MASKVRRRRSSLIARLRTAPYKFTLLQAVAIAEAEKNDALPIGAGFDPTKEALKFRGSFSQGFPASDLVAWTDNPASGQPELTSAFLSLGGAFGPLPPPYTELVKNRLQLGDTGLRDFLDIFNHRLLSIFIRIKRAHRPALQSDLPEDTHFSSYLWAVLGLLTPGLRQGPGSQAQSRIPDLDHILLACSGLLNQRPVSAHMLEQTLRYAFHIPVHIQSFVGRWQDLDTDQTTVLGRNGRNCILGKNAMAGQRIWDQAAAICIQIYPQNLMQLKRFLPGAACNKQLQKLIQYLLGDFTACDVTLHLPAKEIPGCQLSYQGSAAQLGWTSWLTTTHHQREGCIRYRLKQ